MADLKWFAEHVRRAPMDPELRQQQVALLDKAVGLVEAGKTDASVSAELSAWALMQRSEGRFPFIADLLEDGAAKLAA